MISGAFQRAYGSQRIRFLFIGGWNTVFGYLVFVLLDTIFSRLLEPRYVAYMSAMVAGNFISVTNAYIFHKYITFKSDVKGKGMITEFFRFSMTYVVTFCLSLILLPFFVEVFHISPKLAGLIVVLLCTVVSYTGHSRFSFRRENK